MYCFVNAVGASGASGPGKEGGRADEHIKLERAFRAGRRAHGRTGRTAYGLALMQSKPRRSFRSACSLTNDPSISQDKIEARMSRRSE